MKASGYYDRHSGAQLSSIEVLRDWIDDAVAGLPLPVPARPVTVLDLGSSEGRNAVHLMGAIVDGLRRRTAQPIQTIYSDLPSNNFSQLFANLDEARQQGLSRAGVYPSAVAASFYGPLVPPGTVHLATCFNSIQWLDELPRVPLPDSVAYRRPHPGRKGRAASPEAQAAFTRQAERDLVRFLECRARELVPGGKLLLATPGDTDQVHVGDGFVDLLNDACLDLVASGRVERSEFESLTIPAYCRTVEELLAPLESEDSPLGRAFVVDGARDAEVPTPFLVRFRRDGDVAAYARAYTGFLRAISEPVVLAAVGRNERGAAAVESLYDRIHARLSAEPERYAFRYILVAALLTRC
jgi:hypothetical protein